MELIPGKKYFLKWVKQNIKGSENHLFITKVNELFIIECEFIKYYDNTYEQDYIKYIDDIRTGHDAGENFEVLSARLMDAKIISPFHKRIEPPFEDPLYPYNAQLVRKNDNIGLFKFIRVVNKIYDGIQVELDFNPGTLIRDFLFDTVNNSKYPSFLLPDDIVKVGTLFWINLGNVNIIESDVEQRIIHEKTLTGLEERLPTDMTREIAKFVGSAEYMNKGGKKSKKRKNKSKKRKNKSKKLRRNSKIKK